MTPWKIPPCKPRLHNVANIVFYYRSLMNLTQKQLAMQAGFSKTFISSIETGRRGVRLGTWMRLARVLNIPDDISWGENA